MAACGSQRAVGEAQEEEEIPAEEESCRAQWRVGPGVRRLK